MPTLVGRRPSVAALLQVDSLSVTYGAIAALHNVSVRVEEGERVAILGANGAGKSSLLRAVSGLVGITTGSVRMAGQELTTMRPAQIARLGVTHVPEGRQVFGRLTVRDNLRIGGLERPGGPSEHARMEYVLQLFPRLSERLNQIAGTLSGGEQQMLAIGRGLMARPRLIMLDEPSMGLSPLLVRVIFEALDSIGETTTVLIVEQNVRAALAFAKRGYLLEAGQVIAEGSPDALTDESIRAAYLGDSSAQQ